MKRLLINRDDYQTVLQFIGKQFVFVSEQSVLAVKWAALGSVYKI
jgi:hypothetical protein